MPLIPTGLTRLLGFNGVAAPIAGLICAGVSCFCMSPVMADVSGATGKSSLRTTINGKLNGSCNSGVCKVEGGTKAGKNLFHRFKDFDTRGSIRKVLFDSQSSKNMIVGVLGSRGSFITKPVEFSAPVNLFWLSPGGITINNSGSFFNVINTQLSNATGLKFENGFFDVLNTSVEEVLRLSDEPFKGVQGLINDQEVMGAIGLDRNGDLQLSDGLLSVDKSLLLDSQGSNVLLDSFKLLASSGEVDIHGDSVIINNGTIDVGQNQFTEATSSDVTPPKITIRSEDSLEIDSSSSLKASESSKGGLLTCLLGITFRCQDSWTFEVTPIMHPVGWLRLLLQKLFLMMYI